MAYESLINIIPGKPEEQRSIEDVRACKLFKFLWNEKYPNKPVHIKYNCHDFGFYPDIVIPERFLIESEEETTWLVEEWNGSLPDDSLDPARWETIKQATGLTEAKPFRMEY